MLKWNVEDLGSKSRVEIAMDSHTTIVYALRFPVPPSLTLMIPRNLGVQGVSIEKGG